jgi:hypothetical protein
MLFRLDMYELFGASYDSTNDKVFLEADLAPATRNSANSFSYELTRAGDLWSLTPDSTAFGACGIKPGTSRDYNYARLVRQYDSGGGVFKRQVVKRFPLTIERAPGFALNEISGLLAWWDAWDLAVTSSGNTASGTSVATWADRSDYKKDLYEGTNQPTLVYDGYGRPCVKFDGTNDKLTSIISGATGQAGKFAVPMTLFLVCRQRIIPGSATIIARIGSAVPIDVKVINSASAGLTAVNTATDTAAVTLEDNLPFLATMTKASGGAVTIYHNVTAGSGAGTAAVTADVLVLGSDGASAFAGVDIFEAAVYNAVLSSANRGKVQRALCAKWGINL